VAGCDLSAHSRQGIIMLSTVGQIPLLHAGHRSDMGQVIAVTPWGHVGDTGVSS